MSFAGQTAYITGGASGIGRALAQLLLEKGMTVCIADLNIERAKQTASELSFSNGHGEPKIVAVKVDVADWDSQEAGFQEAIKTLGRIDYVFPVAGVPEGRSLPKQPKTAAGAFAKPDFTVYNVCGAGMLYTIWLGVQHFRRQKTPNRDGFLGKIICVSSVTGVYSFPGSPVYSAAKHAVVGFVRSYGKVVEEEKITLNAVCPGIIETNISSSDFYDEARKRGCLVMMEHMMDGFLMFMGSDPRSGECAEVIAKHGARIVQFPVPSRESAIGRDFVIERHRYLNE